MKKIFLFATALLTMSLGFTSCGDDDDDASYNYSTTPEIASAGTYTGTWTRVNKTDGSTAEFDGTITLDATDTKSVTSITFSAPGASLNAVSLANIWNANDGFQFMQNLSTGNAANGLGVAFAGYIDDNATLTTSFTLSQRSGRVNVSYVYNFKGVKVGTAPYTAEGNAE